MKILLHGATNFHSSNLGDYIYGESIYNYIQNKYPKAEIQFYQPSNFFVKNINGYKDKGVTFQNADLILYIPGGYFGEGHNARLRDNIIQFIRFMPLGIIGGLLKKKIAIIGIGAGPINNLFMRIPISFIGKRASVVTVRDSKSYLTLRKLGISNVVEGADMILTVDYNVMGYESEQLNRIKKTERKVLFVHYNHSIIAMKYFSKVIKAFMKKNDHYLIVVGSDQLLDNEEELYKEFCKNADCECMHYHYDSPYEMVEFLKNVDCVLTCKLHVGVLAALFNKSVISVAIHPEKTMRFYESIYEECRCVSLYDTSVDEIRSILEKYIDIPINVPKCEIERSYIHWEILRNVLNDIYEK